MLVYAEGARGNTAGAFHGQRKPPSSLTNPHRVSRRTRRHTGQFATRLLTKEFPYLPGTG